MRPIIILCLIFLGKSATRAQLNYEGNPLTDNTEYTAEESHVSGRHARRDYQRFEVADGRTAGTTKGPFTPSPRDAAATADNDFSRKSSNANNGQVANKTRGSPMENERSPDVPESISSADNYKSPSESQRNEINTAERFESHAGGSELPTEKQPTPEARQLREYSVQSHRPMSYSSAVPQDSYHPYAQSQNYVASPQTSQLINPESYSVASSPSSPSLSNLDGPYEGNQAGYYPPASPASLASGQALNDFLNSRTPEESQMALQNYLAIRERAASGAQNYAGLPGENGAEPNGDATAPNGSSNDDYAALQRQEIANAQRPNSLTGAAGATKVVQDRTGQASYSSGPPYPLPRANHIDAQLRQNNAPFIGPGRPRPRYRSQMGRFRGRPWAQSRVDPRGQFYHPKGPVYSGPPPPPGPPGPPGFAGKWKPPVEVIYTRPPGFGHGPPPVSNPPVPYEDASHWFPEASEPPPQKNVYYSQLYAQSYDPHYYNYIAKTGKIKPWLYGKLGKHEEKSIWWELFAGFKKHGMKNMMNPMFLLGMTIPTLTIILSALVQKRSLLARSSDSGGYATEKMIDEYAQRLRDYIECYERRIKDENGSEEKKCW